jgi:predicted solute-binding protein
VVIVVEGAGEGSADAVLPPLDEALRQRMSAGERLSDLARALAEAYGLPRQEVYARALALKDG